MIDDSQIDRLVDGELDDAERRDILSRLDVESGGWRRCALAFLEAQSWREEMRSMAREPAEATATVSKSRRLPRRFRTALAMAASFLLALGLGLVIDDMVGRPGPAVPPEQLAGMQPPEESNSTEPIAPSAPQLAPEANVPYQYVDLPARNPVSGEADLVRMPVIPGEYADEGWPLQLPSALPDHVVRSLQQSGHEVVQQRRLVPFQAEDGRRIVFPVDEVELVPVANRGYQ